MSDKTKAEVVEENAQLRADLDQASQDQAELAEIKPAHDRALEQVDRLRAVQPKTVHRLWAELMGRVGAVPKEGKTHGYGDSYSYQRIEDIVPRVQAAAAELEVIIIPERVEELEYTVGVFKGGGGQRTRLRITWRVWGPNGDSFKAQTIGEANDASDKTSNKAQTAGQKQFMQKALLIPTKDDSGADPDGQTEPTYAPAPQAEPAPAEPSPHGLAVADAIETLDAAGKEELRRWLKDEAVIGHRNHLSPRFTEADAKTVMAKIAELEAQAADNEPAPAEADEQPWPEEAPF